MGTNNERPVGEAVSPGRRRGELAVVETVASPEHLRQVLRRARAASTLRLGARLVELGLITQDQLNGALHVKESTSSRHLGEILLDLGAISKTHLQQVLCERLGIPLVDLTRFPVDPAVLRLLPEALVRTSRVLPVCQLDGRLVVAAADPLGSESLDRVRFFVQTQIWPVMASNEDIEQAIAIHYGAAAVEADEAPVAAEPDVSAVALVTKILADGSASGATDIHIDGSLGPGQALVRFRRGGKLVEYTRLPAQLRGAVVSRLKALAGIDLSDRRRAQEGRIETLEHCPEEMHFRVITVPTSDGNEDVAIKVEPEHELPPLETLGMSDAMLTALRQLAVRPHGLLLVAAPAAGGKTTTAHAMLDLLKAAGLKIWTAEERVEIERADVSQVEVNERAGWDFPTAVRTIARADPDVLLVGDVRDRETAALAVAVALRGCRVVATVRGNSAADAVGRLLDLGLDPFALSDALLGVVAQRLARRLCVRCRSARALTDPEVDALLGEYCYGTQFNPVQVRSDWTGRYGRELREYRSPGCAACGSSGYRGRIGLFELLSAGPAIRPLLGARRPVAELTLAAIRSGMRTIKQDGIDKALAGHCDMREVRAATA